MSIKISAALATFNEEKNISNCIESLKLFADEIVIADGTSTDKTPQIAKKLGVTVITTSNKEMFHINKNLAIRSCHGEWVFLIDADEVVSPELAEEIKKTVEKTPPENGFWVNRKNWFLGGYLKKGGAYPDPVIRLFRKGKGILPEISVHEQVKIEGNVGHLKEDLLHFADPNFKRYLQRANRYTTQTAYELKNQGKRPNILTSLQFMLFKPSITFIKIYFRHKGFEDGFRGFIWAFFSSIHFFYAYVKFWEFSKK